MWRCNIGNHDQQKTEDQKLWDRWILNPAFLAPHQYFPLTLPPSLPPTLTHSLTHSPPPKMQFLATAVLATIVLAASAKNVPRPSLPSWSTDGASSPLLPPIPRFRLHGAREYAAAPVSGGYLDLQQQQQQQPGGCRCLACKCRTGHQNIEVAVIEE